jgi:hypothetical protein
MHWSTSPASEIEIQKCMGAAEELLHFNTEKDGLMNA